MKKNQVVFFFAAILFLSACDNTFEVTDQWKRVPVIYGLLNQGDTAQYIRVEKAFLDPNTNALVVAQIADSIFFQNAAVELQELDGGGGVQETIALNLVDANLEGYPRVDGIFASSPNWVFKTTEALDDSKNYRVIVNTGDNASPVEGTTPVIGDFELLTPPSPQLSGTFRLWNQLQPARFTWEVDSDATFFDLVVRLHYKEVLNGTQVDKFLDWKLGSNLSVENNNPSFSIEDISHTLLLEFLANNLEPVANICRDIINLDVRVSAGGEELKKYLTIGQANVGITGVLPLNSYSNLSEGFGIFSTRYFINVEGIKVSNQLVDAIAFEPLTSNLGFRSSGDPDCN